MIKVRYNGNVREFLPQVGKNGKLYFNYGVGAIFKSVNNDKWIITKAELVEKEDKRMEYYILESDKGMPLKQTTNRLFYLVNKEHYEIEDEGELTEYPLTKEEVGKYYYYLKCKYLKDIKKLENAKNTDMKLLEIYGQNNNDISNFNEGKIDEAEFDKRAKEHMTAEEERFKELNIDMNVVSEYKKFVNCECEGRGIDYKGNICKCARAKAERIKEWNAQERLKECDTKAEQ